MIGWFLIYRWAGNCQSGTLDSIPLRAKVASLPAVRPVCGHIQGESQTETGAREPNVDGCTVKRKDTGRKEVNARCTDGEIHNCYYKN